MKNNFKVVEYKSDRLIIMKNEAGGKRYSHDARRVVVRLFDEATVNRLLEAGNQHPTVKCPKQGTWWK